MNVFTKISSDKTFFWSLLLSLFFTLFNTIYAFLSYANLPPLIPLYNQLPWGEARLGTKIEIFIPIATALAIFLTNLFLSSYFYKKTPLISRILSITSLLITFFALATVIRTIRLIT